MGNLCSIIYDRSPLQERAPRVVSERMKWLGKMAVGNVVVDISGIPYPTIEKSNLRIGIIVESKATSIIRFFRKTTMSYGPIDWDNLDFKQDHDDLIFTRLNHDEMYYRFDLVGKDILHFLKSGSFREDARRTSFDWDPFEKFKE